MTDRALTPERFPSVLMKIPTPFGTMHLHVDHDGNGKLLGGSISDPQKDRGAEICKLIQALSAGLNECLGAIGDTTAAVREAQG